MDRSVYVTAGVILALVVGTSAAAGSAQQRALASPIYSGFTISATAQPTVLRCGGYVVTRARYRGRASTSPDPRLQGSATLNAQFVTTAPKREDGFATGRLTIRDGRGRVRASANLNAVISKGREVHGLLTGRLMRPRARLLANVSLFFSNIDYTFAGVNLGLNQAQNSAVAYSLLRNCSSRRGGARR